MNKDNKQKMKHGTVYAYDFHGCRCNDCKEVKVAANASNREKASQKGLLPDDPRHGTYSGYSYWGCRCAPCKQASQDYWLKRKYALDDAALAEIHAISNCEICGQSVTAKALIHRKQMGNKTVDHCHTTGQVRGVLCENCNKGLGLFKDSPERLLSAARYLLRFQEKEQNNE